MHLSKQTLISWVSILMGIFLLLTYGVYQHTHWIAWMDHFGQSHLRTAVYSNKTTIIAFVTDILGIYLPALLTVIYVGVLIKHRNFKRIIWFISSILLSTLVIPTIIKGIVDRPRPTPRLVMETTSSFPSGHSTSSSFFYWFILFIVLSWGVIKLPQWFMALMTLMLILFVMWTRIYLNVHYLSDVSAGFTLGLMEAFIFWFIGQSLLKNDTNPYKKAN